MLSPPWLYVTALGAAFVLAALASPVGVSGAVLLLPFQVSVLGTPSPAVTPTNLLYNIVATPGALYRYWRQQQTGGPLTRILLVGTVPGVIVGAIVRVEFLPGDRAFAVVVAAVLIPLGVWTLVGRRGAQTIASRPTPLPFGGHSASWRQPWAASAASTALAVGRSSLLSSSHQDARQRRLRLQRWLRPL